MGIIYRQDEKVGLGTALVGLGTAGLGCAEVTHTISAQSDLILLSYIRYEGGTASDSSSGRW